MEQVVLQLEDFVINNEIDLALKKLKSVFSLSNSELVNDASFIGIIYLNGNFRRKN